MPSLPASPSPRARRAPEAPAPQAIASEGSLAFALMGSALLLAAIEDGESLSAALPRLAADWALQDCDRGAISALTHYGLRHWGKGRALLAQMTAEPPGPSELRCLLELCLALAVKSPHDAGPEYTEFTLVNQAVNAARSHPQCAHGAGLMNALLRRLQRERAHLQHMISADPLARDNCPSWWSKKLRKQYGEGAEAILQTQRSAAPLTLRINPRKTSLEAYCAALDAAGIGYRTQRLQAIELQRGVAVDKLPGFADGLVSVQDFGAQLAAHFLQAKDGQTILDACAAPGGKSAHVLETAAVHLTAIDNEPTRLERITQGLARLGLQARVELADAAQPHSFKAGRYDAILVDAPCSGSGVASRHPDMLWLRRESDIGALKKTQAAILDALWPHVAPGGRLLYCTCSVFKEEGLDQANAFLKRQPEAAAVPLETTGVRAVSCGAQGQFLQLFPQHAGGEIAHDGFFYALFEKRAA